MENLPEKDNVVPIERGYINRDFKLGELVNKKLEKLLDLHRRILDLLDKKRDLYSSEVKKQKEMRDEKLIELFLDDLKELGKKEELVGEEIEKGLKLMEELAEKLESIGEPDKENNTV